MSADRRPGDLPAMIDAAERMDALADTAELMGDVNGSLRWRERATQLRVEAMNLLDD